MSEFEVRDSGQRKVFESGMVRDSGKEGKTDYTLVFDGPMFKRWAEHLTKGAVKYEKRNWMKAKGQEELDHALESLGHHFIQYLDGDKDEDHAAAIFFNINLIEYIKDRMKEELVDKPGPGKWRMSWAEAAQAQRDSKLITTGYVPWSKP